MTTDTSVPNVGVPIGASRDQADIIGRFAHADIHAVLRPAAIGGIAVAIMSLLGLGYALYRWYFTTEYFPSDALTYVFAGLRLETGGTVYHLRSTDPFHWWENTGVPLYGPPLMASVGRLLYILGPVAFLGWTVLTGASALWAVGMGLVATRGWGGVILIAVTPALTLLIGIGNVDGLILALLVAAWSAPPRLQGALIGAAVAFKLTPAALLIWLVVTRRWWALASAVVTICALCMIVAATTRPDAFVEYVAVMLQGTRTGHWWAVPVIVVGLILLWLARKRPDLAWVIAIAIIPLGSPQSAAHTSGVFVAAIPAFAALVTRLWERPLPIPWLTARWQTRHLRRIRTG